MDCLILYARTYICTYVYKCRRLSNLLELESLFNEAWNLLSKSKEKRDHLQALESKLCITDDLTRQQCTMEGKHLAIKRKLELLQADMEMFYLSIKKKHVAIQSFAST